MENQYKYGDVRNRSRLSKAGTYESLFDSIGTITKEEFNVNEGTIDNPFGGSARVIDDNYISEIRNTYGEEGVKNMLSKGRSKGFITMEEAQMSGQGKDEKPTDWITDIGQSLAEFDQSSKERSERFRKNGSELSDILFTDGIGAVVNPKMYGNLAEMTLGLSAQLLDASATGLQMGAGGVFRGVDYLSQGEASKIVNKVRNSDIVQYGAQAIGGAMEKARENEYVSETLDIPVVKDLLTIAGAGLEIGGYSTGLGGAKILGTKTLKGVSKFKSKWKGNGVDINDKDLKKVFEGGANQAYASQVIGMINDTPFENVSDLKAIGERFGVKLGNVDTFDADKAKLSNIVESVSRYSPDELKDEALLLKGVRGNIEKVHNEYESLGRRFDSTVGNTGKATTFGKEVFKTGENINPLSDADGLLEEIKRNSKFISKTSSEGDLGINQKNLNKIIDRIEKGEASATDMIKLTGIAKKLAHDIANEQKGKLIELPIYKRTKEVEDILLNEMSKNDYDFKRDWTLANKEYERVRDWEEFLKSRASSFQDSKSGYYDLIKKNTRLQALQSSAGATIGGGIGYMALSDNNSTLTSILGAAAGGAAGIVTPALLSTIGTKWFRDTAEDLLKKSASQAKKVSPDADAYAKSKFGTSGRTGTADYIDKKIKEDVSYASAYYTALRNKVDFFNEQYDDFLKRRYNATQEETEAFRKAKDANDRMNDWAEEFLAKYAPPGTMALPEPANWSAMRDSVLETRGAKVGFQNSEPRQFQGANVDGNAQGNPVIIAGAGQEAPKLLGPSRLPEGTDYPRYNPDYEARRESLREIANMNKGNTEFMDKIENEVLKTELVMDSIDESGKLPIAIETLVDNVDNIVKQARKRSVSKNTDEIEKKSKSTKKEDKKPKTTTKKETATKKEKVSVEPEKKVEKTNTKQEDKQSSSISGELEALGVDMKKFNSFDIEDVENRGKVLMNAIKKNPKNKDKIAEMFRMYADEQKSLRMEEEGNILGDLQKVPKYIPNDFNAVS